MIEPRGLVVFALTYVLISGRRLAWLPIDRPAGALLGAVAAVAIGALTPREAVAAVDLSTLLLLLGVMGMGAFLAVDGVFDRAARALVRHARTPSRLLGALVWSSGGLAALVTNDAVCVLGAPLVVGLVRRHRLPPLPFLLALATASNTGSVATLVGNPQNMLCASLGGLAYRDHLLLVGPIAVLSLAANHLLLALVFRRALAGARLEPESTPVEALPVRARVSLLVIAGTAVAYTLGADLAWASAGGFVALMLIHRRDTRALWPHVDGTLLLFFAGLFVVVRAFETSGAPAWLFARFPLMGAETGAAAWWRLGGLFVVGSNLVSNVPFILVVRGPMAGLPDPRLGWELLTVASTFAGNLTLLGSVANVIVAEGARELGGLGFLDHLKVGLPLTLITTAIGIAWLLAFA